MAPDDGAAVVSFDGRLFGFQDVDWPRSVHLVAVTFNPSALCRLKAAMSAPVGHQSGVFIVKVAFDLRGKSMDKRAVFALVHIGAAQANGVTRIVDDRGFRSRDRSEIVVFGIAVAV